MASQRMIFLVALLLAVALGCHGGRVCHTTKDCPSCKTSEPLCADGVCTCLNSKTDVESDGRICHTDKECPPCKVGEPLCTIGFCTCSKVKTDDDVVNQKQTDEDTTIVPAHV